MSYAETVQPSFGSPVTRAVQTQPCGEPPREDIRIASAEIVLHELRKAGWKGIRVLGDVHGAFAAFDKGVCEAQRDKMFVLQLGDTIDRGEYSPLCVDLMLDLERRGDGQMLLGNHDYKFARFVRFGTNNASSRVATLIQFEDYSPDLLDRFIDRIEQGPLWVRMGSWFFVHAAFDPRMLEHAGGEADWELAGIALFGAGRGRAARRPAAIQSWVDRIPEGLTVVVGHTITPSRQIECRCSSRGSTTPPAVRLLGVRATSADLPSEAAGGRAVFLDTGGWQNPNGTLATLDIPFDAVADPAA